MVGYDNEFTAGAHDTDVKPASGARSIADAKRTGHGYTIGAQGAHTAASGASPETHLVRPGDTLWELSRNYYGQPWRWPELWSYNPEITNPHWIYPLDHVRLSPAALAQEQQVAALNAGGSAAGGSASLEKAPSSGVLSGTETAAAVVVPRAALKPGMIFLHDQGYLDSEALRRAGQVIAGNEENMLLGPSDEVYVRFEPGAKVTVGQSYTAFRTLREGHDQRHENEKGDLVRIIGTVVVRSYDAKKSVARALITEALEPIERGLLVARMDRRFDVVTPRRNNANVKAHIIASVQPRTLLAFDNVVFLDVGAGHGIQPGNRFFVIRRGDDWLAGITTNPRNLGNQDEVPTYDPELLPTEVVAELRVLKVRKSTTIALVTRSDYDLALGEVAEMRTGF
jgi:hypothetical protein